MAKFATSSIRVNSKNPYPTVFSSFLTPNHHKTSRNHTFKKEKKKKKKKFKNRKDFFLLFLPEYLNCAFVLGLLQEKNNSSLCVMNELVYTCPVMLAARLVACVSRAWALVMDTCVGVSSGWVLCVYVTFGARPGTTCVIFTGRRPSSVTISVNCLMYFSTLERVPRGNLHK